MNTNEYEEYAACVGSDPPMTAVVSRPAGGQRDRSARAVVLLGAGLVHHVGPNRLTVRLARRLAARGLASVRFDHRGIGDSAPGPGGQSFEVGAIREAREVMDHMERSENVRSFVLLGICSGAETALGVALEDPRVSGAVMINGGGQRVGEAWDAYEFTRSQVRHYLSRAVLSLDSWRRALTGRIQYRLLLAVLANRIRNPAGPPAEVKRAARATARDIAGMVARGVRLLWVQSEKDFSRDYFETMFGKDAGNLVASGRVRIEVIPFIDHTLTARRGQERFLDAVESWLGAFERTEGASPGPVPDRVAR